jgi:hypothetical protein
MYALGVMSDLGEVEALDPLARLIQDTSRVEIINRELLEKRELKSPWYSGASFVSITVGQAAREAIEKIRQNRP